jgi:hypothetical protein
MSVGKIWAKRGFGERERTIDLKWFRRVRCGRGDSLGGLGKPGTNLARGVSIEMLSINSILYEIVSKFCSQPVTIGDIATGRSVRVLDFVRSRPQKSSILFLPIYRRIVQSRRE